MPTVHPIDEPATTERLTEADKTAIQPPARFVSLTHFNYEGFAMNITRQLVAALAIATLGTSAFALGVDDNNLFPETATPSTLTRAQVQSQVARARADGSLALNRTNNLFAGDIRGSGAVSRDQVKVDLAQARADGTLAVATEDQSRFLVPQGAIRSREEVRAEAREATRYSPRGQYGS
jgi:hypothetical protein